MAQLTITIPDAQVPRVRAALQEALGLDALPTTEEVRQFIINNLVQVVKSVERRNAAEAAAGAVTDITPS